MKKRVFIIHGWGGTPDSNWFPWLKNELEKNNFEVTVPQMPNTDFPKQNEWLTCMKEIIGRADENTFLVGHSLGVIAILRYLETLEKNQKIGGAILVAGFSESVGISETATFFESYVNYEKIKLHCEKIVAINSDDDYYVPIEKGELLRDKLNAKFIILHKAGHINRKTRYFKLPIALEELLRFLNK